MTLRPGDPVPDLPLVDARADEVRLSGMRGETLLIVFLRHLG